TTSPTPDGLRTRARTLHDEADRAQDTADTLNSWAHTAETNPGTPRPLTRDQQHLIDHAREAARSAQQRAHRLRESAHALTRAHTLTQQAPHSDETATAQAQADQHYQNTRHLLPPT
ncbi:hypothetical protein, partial [Nocardiopsis sp. LOL_012]|uniref:hypothetical protein n=1 Tax=Nocardiopsis sp. LOL_012 TaxID=3345409 RepID=UPI003A85AB8B